MYSVEKDKLLIVESGSTKSDWVLIDKTGEVACRIESQGWNPQMGLESNVVSPEIREAIDNSAKVYFYSAGVSDEMTKKWVVEKLGAGEKVVVENDLVAACRAGLGDESGLVGILGTGCNACYWDGQSASMNVPSLGYVLSDEGGGVDLGKELVRAYFYKEMPVELRELFESAFDMRKHTVLENIYRKPYGNRYLAGFAPFISQYEHEWLLDLVKFRFEVYIQKHVIPNFHKKRENIAFVGSVAFAFKDILTELCTSYNMEVVKVSKSATEGLIKYHTRQFYD